MHVHHTKCVLGHDPGTEHLSKHAWQHALTDMWLDKSKAIGKEVDVITQRAQRVFVRCIISESELVRALEWGDPTKTRGIAYVVSHHNRGVQRLEIEYNHRAVVHVSQRLHDERDALGRILAAYLRSGR